MTIKLAVGAAFISTLALGQAHAATTHVFDLSRTGDTAVSSDANSFTLNSDVLTEGGDVLSGTFTGGFVDGLTTNGGGEITGGTFDEAIDVERYFNGAGVCRSGECTVLRASDDEPHSVDGTGETTADYFEMAFSIGDTLVDVTLTSLTFGWIGDWTWSGTELGVEGTTGAFEIILDTLDGGGDLGIGLGDTLVLSDTVTPNLEVRRSRGAYDLTDADLIDSIFGVKAGDNGSWKLLTATVEFDGNEPPIGPPPAIPLPAGAWLLLSGLGGIVWLRRRRQTT